MEHERHPAPMGRVEAKPSNQAGGAAGPGFAISRWRRLAGNGRGGECASCRTVHAWDRNYRHPGAAAIICAAAVRPGFPRV